MVPIRSGIYEQLINTLLHYQLEEFSHELLVEKEKADQAELPYILSRYLCKAINTGLKGIKGTDKENKQIQLCNKIIHVLADEIAIDELKKLTIPQIPEILLSIINTIEMPSLEPQKLVRPVTPLAESSLFTGSPIEPTLASEIRKEILSSDEIFLLMSFLKWSGIRIIADELEEFTKNKNGTLKIITTSYMGASDYEAIEFLASLPNTEIKVSYDTKRTRLHAKAYIFHRKTTFSTAYIGSSNISRAAMTSGLEWNIKITAQDSPDIFEKCVATFHTYWNDKEFVCFTLDDEEKRTQLKQALLSERQDHTFSTSTFNVNITPYLYQEEILEKLEAERTLRQNYRNLVVAATGTGKTIISAFDYKRFCKNYPHQANRLLFVAHREEILKQSIDCFRMVLQDYNFGDMLVGFNIPQRLDHLFVSIQSFHSKNLQDITQPDFYDFIIVDEFHHSAAPSYRKLLTHYDPKVLLGLTATPERMDGSDIINEYFDGRIAAEIRLPEAIQRKLLVPFQYFGVTDTIDFSHITWSRGGYDTTELDRVLTGNDQRAQLVVNALYKYVRNPLDVYGLGFCVSVNHAEYMARFFQKQGIPSECLHGNSSKELRQEIQRKLHKKEINFIFVVDIYNEGVDIPFIDTVLFLRPTESLTVFLQQLGRGLRIHEEKECLTVLDFVGQAHKQYSFEAKFRALLGRTQTSIKKEIEQDFPNLPAGCFIKLEKRSKEYILHNIQKYFTSNTREFVRKIATFEHDSGQPLNLANFLNFYKLGLSDIYSKTSWSSLCYEAKVLKVFDDPDKETITKGLKRIQHINSREFITFLLKKWKSLPTIIEPQLSKEERQYITMFYYDIWQKPLQQYDYTQVSDIFQRLFKNRNLSQEIQEILQYNYDHVDFIEKEAELTYPCVLDVHSCYTRDEILSAFGYYSFTSMPSHREGVRYFPHLKTDIFLITLNKSEKDYSPSTMYEDYAINETLFHWQSQSTTSETSSTGQRYINHRKTGNIILLFVRENKREQGFSAPYHFLGTANYISHSGSRPMNITWELDIPIPSHLLKINKRLAV
ncbi:superfamily II DNA/RNA helicase [Candidatus Vecturithrix granuli]|uniref:Superfamily II DNA/RNA helicase n=1 Tax=Vecturithrix granuli TaxID=1499967 RepID=A0A081BUK8_VECG1|nr:superfamily II DNA/RNA helicase [Candidatus Vecturithrix granuli]